MVAFAFAMPGLVGHSGGLLEISIENLPPEHLDPAFPESYSIQLIVLTVLGIAVILVVLSSVSISEAGSHWSLHCWELGVPGLPAPLRIRSLHCYLKPFEACSFSTPNLVKVSLMNCNFDSKFGITI